MDKIQELENLNKTLKSPNELSGEFLPNGSKKKFDFMFLAEMPSMNEPEEKLGDKIPNFGATARDKFLCDLMEKYGVAGSYVTDIVKSRDIPRRPTKKEINDWLPFLLREIKILKPKAIVIIGKTNYDSNFKKFVESSIPKNIKIDWIFHYSQQGAKTKKEIEQRFADVIQKIKEL